MGNTDSQSSLESPLIANTKMLNDASDRLSRSRHLDGYYASIVRRVFAQPNQTHLIHIMQKISAREEMEKFLDQVQLANIQILDSFYQHIVLKNHQKQSKLTRMTSFDEQLFACQPVNAKQQQKWQDLSTKYVDIVDLSQKIINAENYQRYKEEGLELIRQQKGKNVIIQAVCFIILAGGKNIRYDLNKYKQCEQFQSFPSKPCLMTLLLKKFQALGRLIDTQVQIFFMVGDQQKKAQIKKVRNQKLPNLQYISVDFITQISYGALDIKGGVVLDNNNNIFMHPNGNGDLWAYFQGTYYQKSGLQNYKYIQVMGVSNILEHGFDCYMIGKAAIQGTPWVTMASHRNQEQQNQHLIYVDSNKNVRVHDLEESCDKDIQKKCKHIFLNNTVFSSQFLLKAVNSEVWQYNHLYHCKHKNIGYCSPLSEYNQILVFEKQYSDIFSITTKLYIQDQIRQKSVKNQYLCGKTQYKNLQKGTVVIMNAETHYCPFLTKNDKILGMIKLSETYKNWLNIGQKNIKMKKNYSQSLAQICQIDPFVSLQGQNLQEVVSSFTSPSLKIEFPIYIGPEETDFYSQPFDYFNTPMRSYSNSKAYENTGR